MIACTLISLLISILKSSIFHIKYVIYCFFKMNFITLREFPSVLSVYGFYEKWILNFIKRHFAILWDDYINFKIIYSVNGIRYPNFGMLKKSCIPIIHSNFTLVLFIFCWGHVLWCLLSLKFASTQVRQTSMITNFTRHVTHELSEAGIRHVTHELFFWEKSPVSQCLRPVDNPTITYTDFYAEFCFSMIF